MQYVEETKEPALNIITEFSQIGDDLANDLGDPVAGNIIRLGMLMLGIILACALVVTPILAIKKAFKI